MNKKHQKSLKMVLFLYIFDKVMFPANPLSNKSYVIFDICSGKKSN